MKRNIKPFSVEIKKSRVQDQRHHLPPRRLFEIGPTSAEVTYLPQEEPQATTKPSAAPRILPSIIEPVWSRTERVESGRRKHSAAKTGWHQIELELTAAPLESVMETHSAVSMVAAPVAQADIAGAVKDMTLIHDAPPVQGESGRSKSRKPRKKTSEALEETTASHLMTGLEQLPEAEMMWSRAVTPPKADEHRRAKRQTAAAQLSRHERWKRRLHPASW